MTLSYALVALKTEPGTIQLIRKDKIIAVKAAGNYVEVFCGELKYLHRSTLSAFINKLTEEFVRVHRSYVINLHHLAQLRSELGRYSECVMSNKQLIPISKQYRAELFTALGIKDATEL